MSPPPPRNSRWPSRRTRAGFAAKRPRLGILQRQPVGRAGQTGLRQPPVHRCGPQRPRPHQPARGARRQRSHQRHRPAPLGPQRFRPGRVTVDTPRTKALLGYADKPRGEPRRHFPSNPRPPASAGAPSASR
jgi:hypothetical protein